MGALRFFLIAGEPSGDALGAALMSGLKELRPGAVFDGIGGPAMEGEGLLSRFPMQELSVMGLWEIAPKYFHLKRRIAETARAVAAAEPDALITIDSPDFCLRVARAARAIKPGLRTIHYVAPSVWAWRPGRAAQMAQMIDHVLALLPFEPPFMEAAGMTCDFVGHPVVSMPVATPAEAQAFRSENGIGDAPLVLCLPGSRRGEVARLGPRFGATLDLIAREIPELRVAIPTVAHVAADVRTMVANWSSRPIVVENAQARRAAFAAGDAALAASGTVSLDLAANDVPMVIGYDMAPLSRIIIGAMVKTPTVTLVNLVSETRAVPEFIARRCRPDLMAPPLLELLQDGAGRAAQVAAMKVTMDRLGRNGEPPGLRAAKSVLAAIEEHREIGQSPRRG